MKKHYTSTEVPNPVLLLRKAGYAFFRDPQTQEESFIIRLTPDFYPRFHLYVLQDGNGISFNLHLDQKKPSYGDGHAHAGEYEGAVVEKEMARIDGWVRSMDREQHVETTLKREETEKKKGFFAKLFS
jgi:hypothetical protein